MTDASPVTAILLAGQRERQLDPLAQDAGVALKCLSPVAGRPMILHPLAALAVSPSIGMIVISVNTPDDVAALADVRALVEQGRARLIPSQHNLVDSVIGSLAGARYPALVTTADSVLLTPQMIEGFIRDARSSDVAVAFATRRSVLEAHADGQRRFYRFREDAYSNCNAYWLRSAASLGPIEAFRGGGQFAKHPLRIVRAFGLLNLIRFHFGLGSLAETFRRFSRRYGHDLKAVIVEDGAMAIDVDNARTLAVAQEVLARRADATHDRRWPGLGAPIRVVAVEPV